MDERIVKAHTAVLIVEDEPLLLVDAMDLAEEAGIKAYGARNASAALALMERHDSIAILFTDVQMPSGLDGLELAHIVRTRWPHVMILVTSGHRSVTDADMPEGGIFLPKPYSPEQVLRVFRETSQKTSFSA